MRYGWHLNSDSWQALAAAVMSCSWERAYLEADYAFQVPEVSGVYLICAGIKEIPIQGSVMERLYNAIYVGQTTNLRRRFRGHVTGYRKVIEAKDAFRRLDFWFTKVEIADLSRIEQLLLESLGPTANTLYVTARIGSPIPAGRKTRG